MRETVKDYYGRQLQSSADLKTSACCDVSSVPAWLKPLLAAIHPEVTQRYYGCGLVCPPLLEGCNVLDLGCGTGRDVYALAQLVGAAGSVTGVDMTREQLSVAEQYQPWHSEKFGFDNVRFIEGYIESLQELSLEAASFDVIVSNCVINLSADKPAVLEGVKRLLKPGGEFYFADVYADRRPPQWVREDPVLVGECLGGALYWKDFLRLAAKAGFADPRLVEDRRLDITDADLLERAGALKFQSATWRLFNIDTLEDASEDYGQSVVYLGGIAGQENSFSLDSQHRMETGREVSVSGNTWRILKESRFSDYFEFKGDFNQHFGMFEGTGENSPFSEKPERASGSGCC